MAKVLKKYLENPDLVKKAIKGETSGTGTMPAETASPAPAQPESQAGGETESEFEKN